MDFGYVLNNTIEVLSAVFIVGIPIWLIWTLVIYRIIKSNTSSKEIKKIIGYGLPLILISGSVICAVYGMYEWRIAHSMSYSQLIDVCVSIAFAIMSYALLSIYKVFDKKYTLTFFSLVSAGLISLLILIILSYNVSL
jgi:hypothetical protein